MNVFFALKGLISFFYLPSLQLGGTGRGSSIGSEFAWHASPFDTLLEQKLPKEKVCVMFAFEYVHN